MKRICSVLFVVSIALSMTAGAEVQPDTAASFGAAPSIAQAPKAAVVDDPLTAAIYEAKEANDIDLALSLEAQRPTPEAHGGPEIGTEVRTGTHPSYGGVGDPTKTDPPGPAQTEWWVDVDVTGESVDNRERHPSIATASNGDMYVVFEDTFSGNRYVQVYRSLDGGSTWNAWGFMAATGVDLVEPTIAIGEGSTGNLALIAYIKDDGTNEREVEVATRDLAGGPAFSAITVPGQPSLWDYSKPVIWTDSHSYGAWYAYLIAEAIFDDTPTNRNVSFWRSTNGTSFGSVIQLWGNGDADTWMDPDGTFGTTGRDVFVTVFNDTNDTLYARRSTDLGASFETAVVARVFPADQMPSNAVDPDIEAAIDGDNVIIACTKAFNGNDNPAYTESQDNGATWSYLYSMDGYSTTLDEFGVVLNANEGGESFHVAWTDTDWYIHGNSRPQDLSAYFSDTPPVINDTAFASAAYPVKGITSNWTSDMERVVWADFRRSPEYSIYYDEDWFFIIITWIFGDDFESGGTGNWSSVVSP